MNRNYLFYAFRFRFKLSHFPSLSLQLWSQAVEIFIATLHPAAESSLSSVHCVAACPLARLLALNSSWVLKRRMFGRGQPGPEFMRGSAHIILQSDYKYISSSMWLGAPSAEYRAAVYTEVLTPDAGPGAVQGRSQAPPGPSAASGLARPVLTAECGPATGRVTATSNKRGIRNYILRPSGHQA